MANRRRKLLSGSLPPSRTATISSLPSLVKSWPFLMSVAPFCLLIFDHLECPDIFYIPPLGCPFTSISLLVLCRDYSRVISFLRYSKRGYLCQYRFCMDDLVQMD